MGKGDFWYFSAFWCLVFVIYPILVSLGSSARFFVVFFFSLFLFFPPLFLVAVAFVQFVLRSCARDDGAKDAAARSRPRARFFPRNFSCFCVITSESKRIEKLRFVCCFLVVWQCAVYVWKRVQVVSLTFFRLKVSSKIVRNFSSLFFW